MLKSQLLYILQRIINKTYDLFILPSFAKTQRNKISKRISVNSCITYICKGNICRSAFADWDLKKRTPGNLSFKINSAGIHTRNGLPADSTAKKIALSCSINLDNHKTTQTTLEFLSSSDLIFTMEPFQLLYLRLKYPKLKDKLFLFSSLIREKMNSWEIKDPYGKDDTLFKETFHIITKGNDVLVALANKKSLE